MKAIALAALIAATPTPTTITETVRYRPPIGACGIASTYSTGKVTANGERYRPNGISAAHKSLPFGTRVAVRNRRTGRTILVRVNDRGPFVAGRIIDLSTGAHRAIGGGGLIPVCISIVSRGRARTVRS